MGYLFKFGIIIFMFKCFKLMAGYVYCSKTMPIKLTTYQLRLKRLTDSHKCVLPILHKLCLVLWWQKLILN